MAAGQQRQVPELEVRKVAARIRPDCIPKGGLSLFVPPQVGERMPRADEGQRALLAAAPAALAVLQDGLVRGARLDDAPRHLHESALYQLGGGPVDRAVVQAGAERRFGRPARANVVGILVRERVDVGVTLPEHGLEALQAAPVYPPHQDAQPAPDGHAPDGPCVQVDVHCRIDARPRRARVHANVLDAHGHALPAVLGL